MNIFEGHVVGNELIVGENDWLMLKTNYTQEHIIQQISDAIVEFNIKLPYREISYDDMVNDYQKLLKQDKKKLSGVAQWGISSITNTISIIITSKMLMLVTKPVIIFTKLSVGNVMQQDILHHKKLGRPRDSV